MKTFLFLPFLFFTLVLVAQTTLEFEEPVKQRVFVLTDIMNEPDDQQSLVRFLVYANEYDVEGLVATTSTHLMNATNQARIRELVNAFALVVGNLEKHADGFPSAAYLLSVTTEHVPFFSMEGVGEGKDSPGSELLIQAVDKDDNRPLWVSAWGGANCLAQALWKVKQTRSEEEVKKFVKKLRVYTISDQDFSGQWIRQNFPGIFYIVDASAGDNWREYYKATWTGIGGDVFYKNGPGWQHELVENPWLMKNIAKDHGPLGALYPPLEYIMEGDTPSFFGLIQNGLAWYKSPAWGGWAGRYEWYKSVGEVDKIWTSSVYTQDEVVLPDGSIDASNQATIWRWRKAFQHDFAARMDWNIAESYKDANHNPVIVLNGNEGKAFGKGKVKAGDYVRLSSKGTYDPDGDQLRYKWWVYKEAGNFNGQLEFHNPFGEELVFQMPQLGSGQELHVILEVEDSGTPSLTSYRRVILSHP
ncbi:DUF1593 domain-containing protein [Cecembia lonarensis]|uniref:DUF1593 domain-containing protein n=1 Tax=Cecembia lonarensis (strain CCUG 58316 / KCTC 22772 / LW9) TaxID=1225176 RepID=K1LZA6_CECL9|nr:DUF1593 domain-containing protein [Cecembia lonarensis]EKB49449.1 hypothetical protein B879_01935 [Cecembia lonarensis LW9]